MAILSWGKGKLSTTLSIGGEVPLSAPWKLIDTPKEDTLKLSDTQGQVTEATEEGGDVVDSRVGKSKYTLEFDLFVKKGVARPFEDNDGIIAGEHAFRYIPEDESTEGFLIERATVSCSVSYNTKEGKMLHYKVTALKPKVGKIVKEYTANSLVVDNDKVYFGSAVDNTGKTIAATTSESAVTATTDDSWIKVVPTAKTVKITTTEANSTKEIRVGSVIITAGGKSAKITVTQIPA